MTPFKITNKIPNNIEVFTKDLLAYERPTIISNYGFISNPKNDDNVAYAHHYRNHYEKLPIILESKEEKGKKILIFSFAKTKLLPDEICFYLIPFKQVSYDFHFHELEENIILEFNQDEFEELSYQHVMEMIQGISRIYSNIINVNELKKFVYDLLLEDNIQQPLKETGKAPDIISGYNYFYRKINKNTLSIYDNKKLLNEIAKMLTEKNSEFNFSINRNTIEIANMDESIDIITAYKLSERFEKSEIHRFVTVAKGLGFAAKNIWSSLLCFDKLSLTEIGNYLIRNIISKSNIKSVANLNNAVVTFLKDYSEYINITDEQEDLFPDNLKKAHDDIINKRIEEAEERERQRRLQLMERQRIEDERMEQSFKSAVSLKKDLEWKHEDYKIVLPTCTDDLDAESDAQHNCVRGYKRNVASGSCMICFMRKNDKPFMTIEIVGDEIRQAKMFANKLPNEEEDKPLQLWIAEKKLKFVKY